MSYRFTPPSISRRVPVDDTLWGKMNFNVGQTLYRIGGTYTIGENVAPELFDQATEVYLGGHEYWLTDVQVASLTDAGYGPYIEQVDGYGNGPYGQQDYGDPNG